MDRKVKKDRKLGGEDRDCSVGRQVELNSLQGLLPSGVSALAGFSPRDNVMLHFTGYVICKLIIS